MNKTALLTTACVVIAGCASSGTGSQQGSSQAEPAQLAAPGTGGCVARSALDGVEAIDDRTVVLYAGSPRRAYLAGLESGCFNLEFQTMFAAKDEDGDGQICGGGKDSIAYRRLNMLQVCHILELQEASDERLRELGAGTPN